MCTLTMNILKPYAFNHVFKHFISIFIYLLNLKITIIIYPKSHPPNPTPYSSFILYFWLSLKSPN
jgi:hypothetical protein